MEAAGHRCVGSCEIDDYARQIYGQHFGELPEYDATRIVPEKLPDFDCLTAGFPCQAFSVAGKRLGFQESRGTLFFEIARIARQKRPRLLLLENVKGLLSHDRGQTFAEILATLDELGYDAEWQVLNSKHFVPQNRERIFIVGHLRGKPTTPVFPLGEINQIHDSPQEEAPGEGSRLRSSHSRAIQTTPNKGTSTYVGAIDASYYKGFPHGSHIKAVPLRFKNRNQKNFPEGLAMTIDTSNSSGITEGNSIRRLTPTECERLQGFPDGWTEGISDTQRYKCLGNAVTVPVVEYIARKL